jgi:ribosomal protein S27AE
VLYQIVRDHLETFRAEAARAHDGDGLPRFIEEEFHGFLRCGFLAGGFARFHCGRCGLDRLVPFSCKGRAVCPSCGGRRMAERAAHLVDHVVPVVPVRQWVLSLPHRLRYVLAWDHALCRAVTGVFVRAVLGSLRRRARQQGAADGRGGAVAIIQRFGAALNLNIHVHALVLDGVYVEDGVALRFHACDAPTDDEMDRLLGVIERRLLRLLARRGVVDAVGDDGGADRWREEAPVLAGIAAASVQGHLALGERAGAAVRRGGGSAELLALAPQGLGPCHARRNGFDLHAGGVVPPRDRARLERLCRYALRPPIAQERLHRTPEGQVILDLRHRWADGTTYLVFEPLELLERLASLTPRPRINLLLYYGVLGARSAWRSRIAAPDRASSDTPLAMAGDPVLATATDRPKTNWRWAELMQRSFGFDVLACPRCGDRLELIALIENPSVIRRILSHLGLPTEVPAARPARPPPLPMGDRIRGTTTSPFLDSA